MKLAIKIGFYPIKSISTHCMFDLFIYPEAESSFPHLLVTVNRYSVDSSLFVNYYEHQDQSFENL